VNASNRNGDTALILAARNGSESMVSLVLGSKADVDRTNRNGETALVVAVQLRNVKVAKQLLAAGADPDKADYSGHTARDYAKRDDRDPRVQQLFAPKPAN
jgi:ankyrin repeat protein